MRYESGAILGPYEIIGAIGAGGMGEVYRARDARLKREVAIKVLPRELSRDRERLERFEREAHSASALNHRNIVTIHDISSRDEEAFLVMELIRGESLRAILGRGPLPLKRLIAVATGIADGLAAAHAAGIVHRDLKPENVMVTSDGTPKILDFGLAKQAVPVSETSSSTEMKVSRSGVVMGTAAYMSPEQARGERVDFRTDHFSLGMILQEMATGHHPFARPSGIETLSAIINDEPPPLGDAFPEPFSAIVERCLAKNPADRYGSTFDLAHDLRRLGMHSNRHAARDRPGPPRRQRWALAAAVVIAVLLVAAALSLRRGSGPPADSFQTSIAIAEVAHVIRGEVALPLALSPNGRFLVVGGMDADGLPALWLRNLNSGATRRIAQNAFSVGWSADSSAIAFFADGKLKTVPAEGGPARTVCDAKPESTPSWHGDTILYGQYSTEPGIYRVSAAGGKPERIVAPDTKHLGLPWWPYFLPDGERFLYLTLMQPPGQGDIQHELRIGSLDGSEPRTVSSSIHSRAVYANGHLLFVREGTLLAQPFDPGGGELIGQPSPLVDGLHYFRNTGLAAFSVSQTGVLAWRLAAPTSRLVWLDRSGLESGEVARGLFHPDGRLSPEGQRYAVGVIDPKLGVSDIWVYELARNSSERVTFRVLDEKAPVWAPDGQTIYYRSDGGGGPPDIFRWSPGSDEGKVFYGGPSIEEPADISPDGRFMLFVDHRQIAFGDIHVLPLQPPLAPRTFVATPFNEMSPRFSPDGRFVAYQSDLSGRPEVYVRPFDGPAASTRISMSGGTRPRWGRDGKELFFLAPAGRLMSAAMSGGTADGAPRLIFQAADIVDFDPSPDGSRFLVQLQERTSEPPIQLLTNWPGRLAR
ncbi:MAG TPA: protein kinase [Thermoanaerobaculia bacterium]|nr:protein kinase [Thermoanaerobaculia bacterium]